MTTRVRASGAADVAAIGCGLMGSALARTLAGAGHRVSAWNRTYSRAEALVEHGVSPFASVADAVEHASIVVACTSRYDALASAISQVPDWSGKTLVNYTSGTPNEAEDLQRWVTDRGGRYLDGSLVCYPHDIGTETALVCYAGSPDVWAQCAPVLETLGESRFLSDNVRSTNLLLTWWGSFYISVLTAYAESIAYAHSEGVTAAEIALMTPVALEVVTATLPELAAGAESGQHHTDQAAVSTYLEAIETVLQVLHAAGHTARHGTAARDVLAAGRDAGFGRDGLSALVQVLGGNHHDRSEGVSR